MIVTELCVGLTIGVLHKTQTAGSSRPPSPSLPPSSRRRRVVRKSAVAINVPLVAIRCLDSTRRAWLMRETSRENPTPKLNFVAR